MPLSASSSASSSVPSTSIVVVKRPRGGLFAAVRSVPVWLRALARAGRGERARLEPISRLPAISQGPPAVSPAPPAPQMAEGAIGTTGSPDPRASERAVSPERAALCASLTDRGAVVVEGADAIPVAELSGAAAGAFLRGLRDDPALCFDVLDDLTVVDRLPESPRFEVVYFLRASPSGARLRVRARIEVEPPELDSVASIWRSADWLEREAKDLFGVRFRGHPGLLPILLPPDFEGAPLRRDFEATADPAAEEGLPA